MTQPTIHGTLNYGGQRYTLYRAPGDPGNVRPYYFGIAKGAPGKDHDAPPYCAYASVESLFMARGWSMRTPWTPST